MSESRQRTRPLLPTTPSLRYGATCEGCAAQLAACFQHSAQTNGRQSDYEAAALCGAAASPNHLPSQAWVQGAKPIRDSFVSNLIASTHCQSMTRGQFRHKFRRPPVSALTRLSGAKRRDADNRVAFSLGTVLLAKQKKVPRLTGRDPSSVVYDKKFSVLIAAHALLISDRATFDQNPQPRSNPNKHP